LAILRRVSSSVSDPEVPSEGEPRRPGALEATSEPGPAAALEANFEPRATSGNGTGDWLVNVADDVVVPMTTPAVLDGLRAHRLTGKSLVWRIGMHDWTPLLAVPQLRLAAAPPPPTPPQKLPAVDPPQPAAMQAESRRRRNALALGFPAARAPAKSTARADRQEASRAARTDTRPPAPTPRATSASTATRSPARTLPVRLPEAPSIRPQPMPLPRPSVQATAPHSLAPTSAEAQIPAWPAELSRFRALSLALANILQQRTGPRIAVWAALGSVAAACGLIVWLSHTPPPHAPEAAPTLATSALPDAPLVPPPVAASAPPAATDSHPKPVKGSQVRRAPRRPAKRLTAPAVPAPTPSEAIPSALNADATLTPPDRVGAEEARSEVTEAPATNAGKIEAEGESSPTLSASVAAAPSAPPAQATATPPTTGAPSN